MMRKKVLTAKWAVLACSTLAAFSADAQTLFSDNFDSGTIDVAQWQLDERPFESGTSDIQANAASGVLEFSGTVTEQWWPGLALATVPAFEASMETNLVVTVDRLAEFGAGTASRSALFITDASRGNYILFADVRAEGGWHYNRKIGLSGDSPNGSGVDIAAFNDPSFDDGGFHRMKAVANGQTVKLYLDDIFGAEVPFPVSDGIVVQLGSFARATGDTAYTQFDNFEVAAVGAVSFSQPSISVAAGQNSADVTVKIPNGSNAAQPVQVEIISAHPSIAAPLGAQNGALTLTFAAGGPTSQTFKVQGVKSGATTFTFANDRGLLMANALAVNVPFPIGTVLEDSFSRTIDPNRWELLEQGFETGTGVFNVNTENSELVISGATIEQYWAGVSLRTKESFVASKDLMLVFDLDRTSMAQTGTAGRSGVFITSEDRSQFVSFSQNYGENGWTVNVNPGNPTGGGTTLDAVNGMNDLGKHHLKIIADGETVLVYLDDVLGGTFPFPVKSGIHFEIGAYARAVDDTVNAHFDNARVSTLLPCTEVVPADVTTELGVNARSFDVVIPRLLNETAPASVTVTSRNPEIAVPAGATSGSLKLTFPAGATNRQTVAVSTLAAGLTTFDVVNEQGGCVSSAVAVTVTPALTTLLADDFSANSLDATKWRLSDTPFETGTLTNSSATQTGGAVQFHVTPGTDSWPGYSYATVDSFSATQAEPLVFEVDRVSHAGVGASQRTGVWVTDSTRSNFVFFSYDDNNMGWQYNRRINQTGDNATGAGANIAAFDDNTFNDGGNHRLKIVANGLTAKFYIDDVLGAEVPFPFSDGIRFEFGAYARTVRDVLDASFDNALLRGPIPCIYSDVTSLEMEAGGANALVQVTIPRLLNATQEARVIVTSSNFGVAQPVGGNNGVLALVFPAGGPNVASFEVQRISSGTARLSFSTASGLCAANDVAVTALGIAEDLLVDDFESSTLDASKWETDPSPFETGQVDGVVSVGGALDITASGLSNYWGGLGITTKESFGASTSDPLTLKIDRTYLVDNGSTGARSSIWILDSTGSNWVMFADLSESGLGWTFNRRLNQPDDVAVGGGIDMASLNGGTFDDRGLHHVRLVANGQTVRFYVDDVLGAEVPFPFSNGLRFRIGAYARAEFDLVSAGFDNARITGSSAPASSPELQISRNGSEVTITWNGSGVLESASSLNGTWSPVSNAVSPYKTEAAGTKFYRVRQ